MAGRSVDFYFAYEIMTQMVALYGAAFPAREDEAHAFESLVTDLGTTYQIAEDTSGDADRAPAAQATRFADLAERLRRLQPRLNHWTGRRRWLRILRACETCWQEVLDEMGKLARDETGAVAELAAASRERVLFLSRRDAHVRDLYQRRNDAYAVPVPL